MEFLRRLGNESEMHYFHREESFENREYFRKLGIKKGIKVSKGRGSRWFKSGGREKGREIISNK